MMKKLFPTLTLLFLFLVLFLSSIAQPFIEEIREFKHQDSLHFPPKKANLFVGSSSLRLWSSIQQDLSGYKVINRGFGGSSLPDVIRYAGDIILPYKPKQVVVYCGENDLASSDTVSAETVATRFRELFRIVRSKYPKVPIVFISIKPSPSRSQLLPKMIEANRQIREFLATEKHTKYIDVFSLMLTPDGKPREELFGSDRLHMNAAGYAIWTKEVRKVLK
jgi:lysophospholipase L1-like esterase